MTRARAKQFWLLLKDEKDISMAEAAVLVEAMKILNHKWDEIEKPAPMFEYTIDRQRKHGFWKPNWQTGVLALPQSKGLDRQKIVGIIYSYEKLPNLPEAKLFRMASHIEMATKTQKLIDN